MAARFTKPIVYRYLGNGKLKGSSLSGIGRKVVGIAEELNPKRGVYIYKMEQEGVQYVAQRTYAGVRICYITIPGGACEYGLMGIGVMFFDFAPELYKLDELNIFNITESTVPAVIDSNGYSRNFRFQMHNIYSGYNNPPDRGSGLYSENINDTSVRWAGITGASRFGAAGIPYIPYDVNDNNAYYHYVYKYFKLATPIGAAYKNVNLFNPNVTIMPNNILGFMCIQNGDSGVSSYAFTYDRDLYSNKVNGQIEINVYKVFTKQCDEPSEDTFQLITTALFDVSSYTSLSGKGTVYSNTLDDVHLREVGFTQNIAWDAKSLSYNEGIKSIVGASIYKQKIYYDNIADDDNYSQSVELGFRGSVTRVIEFLFNPQYTDSSGNIVPDNLMLTEIESSDSFLYDTFDIPKELDGANSLNGMYSIRDWYDSNDEQPVPPGPRSGYERDYIDYNNYKSTSNSVIEPLALGYTPNGLNIFYCKVTTYIDALDGETNNNTYSSSSTHNVSDTGPLTEEGSIRTITGVSTSTKVATLSGTAERAVQNARIEYYDTVGNTIYDEVVLVSAGAYSGATVSTNDTYYDEQYTSDGSNWLQDYDNTTTGESVFTDFKLLGREFISHSILHVDAAEEIYAIRKSISTYSEEWSGGDSTTDGDVYVLLDKKETFIDEHSVEITHKGNTIYSYNSGANSYVINSTEPIYGGFLFPTSFYAKASLSAGQASSLLTLLSPLLDRYELDEDYAYLISGNPFLEFSPLLRIGNSLDPSSRRWAGNFQYSYSPTLGMCPIVVSDKNPDALFFAFTASLLDSPKLYLYANGSIHDIDTNPGSVPMLPEYGRGIAYNLFTV